MLPEDWKTASLGSCAQFVSGGTPSKESAEYWGGDFPWVTARDMKSLRLFKSALTLTEKGRAVAAVAAVAPSNSILVLTRGMTLLKDLPVCLIQREMAFNQDVKALIAMDGIDPLFLAYQILINKPGILGLVDTAGHGTGRLDTDLLKQYEIRLAPLEEQQRIVKAIRTWDDAEARSQRQLELLKEEKKALMIDLLAGKRRLRLPDPAPSVNAA